MSRSTTGLEPLGKFYGVDIIIGEETRIAACGLGCRRAKLKTEQSRARLLRRRSGLMSAGERRIRLGRAGINRASSPADVQGLIACERRPEA